MHMRHRAQVCFNEYIVGPCRWRLALFTAVPIGYLLHKDEGKGLRGMGTSGVLRPSIQVLYDRKAVHSATLLAFANFETYSKY